MAELLLKDDRGQTQEYGGVTQVKIPFRDSSGNITKRTFTHMTGLYCYAYIPLGGSLRITKKLTSAASDEVWFTGFTEEDLREYGRQLPSGNWGISILITRRGDLKEGEVYTESEYV